MDPAVADLGIRVRVGLHTSEIEIVGGQARGVGVHAAARVAALAGPGEVLVSGTTRDLLDGSGFHLESRGEHELKGLSGARPIFALRRWSSPRRPPPPSMVVGAAEDAGIEVRAAHPRTPWPWTASSRAPMASFPTSWPIRTEMAPRICSWMLDPLEPIEKLCALFPPTVSAAPVSRRAGPRPIAAPPTAHPAGAAGPQGTEMEVGPKDRRECHRNSYPPTGPDVSAMHSKSAGCASRSARAGGGSREKAVKRARASGCHGPSRAVIGSVLCAVF